MIETRKTRFSISFRKHRDEKRKTTYLFTLIIKMQILFARAIITSTTRASSVPIAGLQCHAKSKQFNSPESGERKMVSMQSPSPRFRPQQFFLKQDMWRNVSPKFIEICMETPCWCPSGWAPAWRPETNRNHLSLSFATKAKIYLSRNSKTLK